MTSAGPSPIGNDSGAHNDQHADESAAHSDPAAHPEALSQHHDRQDPGKDRRREAQCRDVGQWRDRQRVEEAEHRPDVQQRPPGMKRQTLGLQKPGALSHQHRHEDQEPKHVAEEGELLGMHIRMYRRIADERVHDCKARGRETHQHDPPQLWRQCFPVVVEAGRGLPRGLQGGMPFKESAQGPRKTAPWTGKGGHAMAFGELIRRMTAAACIGDGPGVAALFHAGRDLSRRLLRRVSGREDRDNDRGPVPSRCARFPLGHPRSR